MYCNRDGISPPHTVLRLAPRFTVVVGAVSADAGGCIESTNAARVTHNPVHVAVHSTVFMLSHLVRLNTRRIVVLRIGHRTLRSTNILPVFAPIPAARDAAFFDTDNDLIRE